MWLFCLLRAFFMLTLAPPACSTVQSQLQQGKSRYSAYGMPLQPIPSSPVSYLHALGVVTLQPLTGILGWEARCRGRKPGESPKYLDGNSLQISSKSLMPRTIHRTSESTALCCAISCTSCASKKLPFLCLVRTSQIGRTFKVNHSQYAGPGIAGHQSLHW